MHLSLLTLLLACGGGDDLPDPKPPPDWPLENVRPVPTDEERAAAEAKADAALHGDKDNEADAEDDEGTEATAEPPADEAPEAEEPGAPDAEEEVEEAADEPAPPADEPAPEAPAED